MAGEQLQFFAFRRSAAAAGATPAPDGRLLGRLSLTLRDQRSGAQLPDDARYQVAGPRDVLGLRPGAVVRAYPPAGAYNVDPDKCAFAELAEPDLPWRYTPKSSVGGALEPWLVLVVGTTEEIVLLPGGHCILQGEVKSTHDLAASKLWAHIQRDPNGHETARILSPRDLEPLERKRLIAALVPGFDKKGDPAWGTDETPVTLPLYYAWEFVRSDTKEGFADLAQKLTAYPTPPSMGHAPLAYQQRDDQASVSPALLVGGALVAPILPPDDLHAARIELGEAQADVDAIRAHLAQLRATAAVFRDSRGRPIVQLPRYGEPWLADPEQPPPWSAQLNSDPRLRGPAGLGLWAGIVLQEEIVDAAAQRLRSFYVAAQRVRQLTAGLAATRALWAKRLPTDRDQRLLLLAPSLARMVTPGGSGLEHVTAHERPLPPALFSSASRRMLRPGATHVKLAGPGAASPAAILDAANDCERFSRPERAPEYLPHTDHLGVALDLMAAAVPPEEVRLDVERLDHEALLGELHEGEEGLWFDFEGVANRNGGLGELARAAVTPEPSRRCRERRVNLDALDEALVAAFDPTVPRPFIVERILATIDGLDDQPLTPPEPCLDFHLPAWKFLGDHAPEWLLPGVGAIRFTKPGPDGQLVDDPDRDPVLAVATNSRFTDAFMVGFNQQALAELRWRNVPLRTGCTPLRRFWEPVSSSDPETTTEDLIGIAAWPADSDLGDASHETPEASGTNLVLVFKTELFRRYPATLVYLAPRSNPVTDDGRWTGDLPAEPMRSEPIIEASIGRDIVLFGFEESPTALDDHWIVVEEVPQGYSFNSRPPPPPPDDSNGAAFAEWAFANPIRVAIQGTVLKPPPE